MLLPLIILSAYGVALNADYDIISSVPEGFLPFFAPIFGATGFFIPRAYKIVSESSDNKWQHAVTQAVWRTSPIPLTGVIPIFLVRYFPDEATKMRMTFFFIFAGIWSVILLATILYKRKELE